MSKFTKAKNRILNVPADYTYSEIKYLLGKFGFREWNKGKTSGSRVKFYMESDQRIIMLHKPHPGDIMDKGAVEDVVKKLMKWGML
ncbi:MAG: type II toxin-antitoxin system HicA family toxin [Lachnospiraceae bacterium]|nr:type II toxin-antitoxin system HicA family toxin [Lachnospiraceae bacterium]